MRERDKKAHGKTISKKSGSTKLRKTRTSNRTQRPIQKHRFWLAESRKSGERERASEWGCTGKKDLMYINSNIQNNSNGKNKSCTMACYYIGVQARFISFHQMVVYLSWIFVNGNQWKCVPVLFVRLSWCRNAFFGGCIGNGTEHQRVLFE